MMKSKKNDVIKASQILMQKCHVIPEHYTMYNGGFLFEAYAKGVKDRSKILNPLYLVDLKTGSAGPFSVAFDIEGYFRIADTFKPV